MVSKVIADQASSGGSGGYAGTFSLAKPGECRCCPAQTASLRSTPGTLAVGTDTSTRFSGTIANTAGLTNVDSGRLVLSGANTYSVVPRARGRYAQPCQN
ncbi:MAG: hypothetical protein WAV78_48000 [Xanthobacteraceae bacterium]